MISVLFSWIVIFTVSLLLGYGGVKLIYGNNREWTGELDVYLVFGLMLINVYAEFFSLFYKVGILACFILFVLGIMTIFCIVKSKHKPNISCSKGYLAELIRGRKWQILLICTVVAATLFWTCRTPDFVDTALYHAQAIRWIEEYGVVPGLGNLHNRFAYNSAFMPLQALFGLKWISGQSLHTVNGYVCALAVVYAIGTNNLVNGKSIRLSDLLKIATLFYVYYCRSIIASPSPDTLAMLLVLYICIKWSEYAEKDIKDAIPYTCLCVFAIWAATVKLTAAVCIIFAVYPAVLLIKNRRWGEMTGNILLGLIVVIPWLARNVIISGYLLYPYPQIDLFNVDWKMLASVCEWDAKEIIVWGREVHQVSLYDLPILKWFPGWVRSSADKVMLSVPGLISATILAVYVCYNIVRCKKINIKYYILFVYSIIAQAAWLFSAPLIRYGMVYLLIPICEVVWIVLEWRKNSLRLQYGIKILAVLLLVTILSIYNCSWDRFTGYLKSPVMQTDYEWRLTDSVEIAEGIRVWYPVEDALSSYDVFPCVPYISMVEKLELRGDGLADGFRVKEEYRNLRLNNAGEEW